MMSCFAAILTAALAGTLLVAGRGRPWASYTLVGLFVAFLVEAFLVGAAADNGASVWAQACISCSLGSAVIGLGLGAHWIGARPDDSHGGRDDNDGRGPGEGPGPDAPHDPAGEPDWWPEFERKLRDYLGRAPERQLERV